VSGSLRSSNGTLGIPSADWKASGPLALSAVALFGNISWFSDVSKYLANMTANTTAAGEDQYSWYRMCAGMPFSTLSGWYNAGDHMWSFGAATSCKGSLKSQMFLGSPVWYEDDSLLKLRYRWLKQFALPKHDNVSQRHH
jgi:hypothetical protein